MSGKSLEMAQNFGLKVEVSERWLGLQEAVGLMAQVLPKDILKGTDEAKTNIHKVLVQGGVNILETLPEQVRKLFPILKEQIAARENRKAFGPEPLSLLAVPVFMDLANAEIIARTEMQAAATQTLDLLTRTMREVTNALQLFLAERMNSLEAEISAHKEALAASQKKAAENSVELAPMMTQFQPKFDKKTESLMEEKSKLSSIFEKVSSRFSVVLQSSRETVFETANQHTGPTIAP